MRALSTSLALSRAPVAIPLQAQSPVAAPATAAAAVGVGADVRRLAADRATLRVTLGTRRG